MTSSTVTSNGESTFTAKTVTRFSRNSLLTLKLRENNRKIVVNHLSDSTVEEGHSWKYYDIHVVIYLALAFYLLAIARNYVRARDLVKKKNLFLKMYALLYY